MIKSITPISANIQAAPSPYISQGLKLSLGLGLGLALLFNSYAQAQESSAINYDYWQVSGAIAKSSIEPYGRKYNTKTKVIDVEFSALVAEDTYFIANVEKSYTNDSEIENGVRLNAKNNALTISGGIGFIIPVDERFHFVAEVGALTRKQDVSASVGALTQSEQDKRSTDFLWSLGFRAKLTEQMMLETKYSQAGNVKRLHIGGPIALTENVGLEIGYTLSKDTTPRVRNKSSAVSLGFRWRY